MPTLACPADAEVTAGATASLPSSAETQTSVPTFFPVLIVPGEGSVTIASRDTEALDQIESLLGVLARGQSGAGRNFVVFSLKNTAATDVAETIERLFRSIGTDWRGGMGKVVAVPDERLNSILVYAARADQSVVENLVRILDSAEIPDSLAIIRPKMIPIKNTRARDIEEILRDIYRTQMDHGGRAAASRAPAGRVHRSRLRVAADQRGDLRTAADPGNG